MSTIEHPRQAEFVLVRYDKVLNPAGAKISFSRASRFPVLKTLNAELGCTMPSSLSARATGFGFGNKLQLKPIESEVSPASYDFPSAFDRCKADKLKQSSFGAGREDYDKVSSYNPRPPVDPDFPGPGDYSDNRRVSSIKYTMPLGTCYDDFFTQAARQDFPGPGKYNDTQQLHYTGSYFNSEFT